MPLSRKTQNKLAFQKSFRMKKDENIPLVAVFIEHFPLDDIAIFPHIFEGLLSLDIQLAVLDPKKTLLRSTLEKSLPHKILFVPTNAMERLLEASDMALFLAKNHKNMLPISQARQSGTVPIAYEFPDAPDMINYRAADEKGNSFLFKHCNQWDIFAAVTRALENFQFPYDWKNILKN